MSTLWVTQYNGLNQPTNISAAPGQPTHLFVTEKTGTVQRFTVQPDGAVNTPNLYLDVSSRTESDGEAGLLSLIFSPHFAKDGYVFITYSDLQHDLVLARLQAIDRRGHVYPAATRLSLSTMHTIITINHRLESNHWGGSLAFGADGYLYMGTGDGGGAGDSTDSSRHITIMRGKVLRLDVLHSCAHRNYCVPKSNPYIKQHAPLVWLFGLRNPWKLNFDPRTHRLWIGDVGQDAYEEVDVIAPTPKLRDLGWPCREGFHSYNSQRCAGRHMQNPLFEIPHPTSEALTGGVIVPTTYPSRAGDYVAGDYVLGKIFWYDPRTRALTSEQLVPENTGGPVAFDVDGLGRVWTVTYSGSLVELQSSPS